MNCPRKIQRWSCAIFFASSTLASASVAPATQQRTVDLQLDRTGRLMADSARVRPIDGQSYWVDPGSAQFLRQTAGSLEPQVIRADLHAPYGLGFDVQAQQFIWTSSADEIVQTFVLGSDAVKNLETSFDEPAAIEIPIEGGKQAITVVGSDVVRVTIADTNEQSQTEVLLSLGADEVVRGLALDRAANVLFVGNEVGMMTYKVDLGARTASRLTFTDHVPPIPDPDQDGGVK
jgi:hypothetical protein